MFKYEEKIVVNHEREKVYKLVANIEEYPKFIPWCTKAELLKIDENNNHYFRIDVKFSLFSNHFITKDFFIKDEKIEIELVEGPFKFLNSTWTFEDYNNNKTLVKFYIEFDFKNKILSTILGKVFLEANKEILKSFLKRLDKYII